MSPVSRRVFLGQSGLMIGAVALGAERPASRPAKSDSWKTVLTTLTFTGWNVYATRFVDPPSFSWNPIEGAAGYVVQFAGARDESARVVRLNSTTFEMKEHWTGLADGCVDLIAWAVDAKDDAICTAGSRRFWKCPDFDGVKQAPVDWKGSIERVMAYLLAPARDEVRDYEKGLPRCCWSCSEDSITGRRRMLSFPALHHPSFIFAYLDYAEAFPKSPSKAAALEQATQYADWLLANRLPAEWKCGLFPFSTISDGKMEGHIEGRNITLFRAARVGEAMVAMYRRTSDEKYLAYARHLADAYVTMQQADGSWPYRVDPKDGKVVEAYTSNAVTPARLLGILEAIEPNTKYAAAREKAIAWVMNHPVKTRRWQGMYEDVGATVAYRNLQHWDTNEMIRYLVEHQRDDASAMQTAAELNRYAEDQFVVWQPSDRSVPEHCPTPTVLEQYTCYRPMESHTGVWILSLLALHRATKNDVYLSKAIAAGNSIVRAQQPNGAYSTWGFDTRFERPFLTVDWPGCNAVALVGLLRLMQYGGA